jgi:DNA-binding CsgD family transcriptional regulator
MTPLAPIIGALRSASPRLLDGASERALVSIDEPMWAVDRLGAILGRASAQRPVLVAVDDLQWADHATLLALSVLPGRLVADPVLWVLARRRYPSSPGVQTLADRITRADGTVTAVEPLSNADAVAVASDVLGAAPDQRLSNLIDQVGGNPFYLVELLGALRRDGAVQVRGGTAWFGGGDVPIGFRAAVAGHVRPLSDSAKQMVEVASVLGRQFLPADVAELTGLPIARLLGPIEEACRADILVDTGDDLAFRHDLLRKAVYEQIPNSVRSALHRGAASVLLARGASWTVVVPHVSVTADVGDGRAVQALEAASAELRGPNPSAAADLALQALDLRRSDDPDRPAAAARAVGLLSRAGRPDEAVPLAEATLASGNLIPTLEARLLVGVRLSNLMNGGRTNHLPPVPASLLDDPALAPSVARTLRLFDAFGRRYDEVEWAERVCEGVVAEAEEAGDYGALALARRMATYFPSARGDLTETLNRAQLAVALADSGTTTEKRTIPRQDVGMALFALDRLDEALAVQGEALSDARLYGPQFVADIGTARALVLLAAGRMGEAIVEADSVTIEAEDARLPHPPTGLLRLRAEVAMRRGDVAAARAAAKEMDTLISRGHASPIDHWVIARVAEAEGRGGDALAAMREPLAALTRGYFFMGVPHFDSWPRMVSAALQAGDRSAALLVADGAAALADRNREVAGLAAAAVHAAGLLNQSSSDLREAVRAMKAGPRPLATADAMQDLADLLETRGERYEAVELRRTAYETYSRAGATGDAARVQDGLRRLGVTRAHRPLEARTGWSSLTAAELAVVRVVAEGVTSQTAAERLYLSVNTVNTHLRHAFAKLGVRSRAELTRVVLTRYPVDT